MDPFTAGGLRKNPPPKKTKKKVPDSQVSGPPKLPTHPAAARPDNQRSAGGVGCWIAPLKFLADHPGENARDTFKRSFKGGGFPPEKPTQAYRKK